MNSIKLIANRQFVSFYLQTAALKKFAINIH